FGGERDVHSCSLGSPAKLEHVLAGAGPGGRVGIGSRTLDHVPRRLPLVVAATEAEIAHLPASVPRVVTGLGKTAAAVATTEALVRRRHEPGGVSGLTVLNVGTAGALRDGLEGLHLPGTVFNHDINAAAIRALGYDPDDELLVGDGHTVLASGD